MSRQSIREVFFAFSYHKVTIFIKISLYLPGNNFHCMRTKRYILSLSLLFVLILGVGNHIFTMVCSCRSSIHNGTEEQHQCGSCCTSHFPDCVNHDAAFEHRCGTIEFSLSEYVVSFGSKVGGSDRIVSGHNLVVDTNFIGHSLRAMLSSLEQQQQWLYSLYDEWHYWEYTPSTGGLRAPPMLG